MKQTFDYTGLTIEEANIIGKLVGQVPAAQLHQAGAGDLFGKLHAQLTAQLEPKPEEDMPPERREKF